MELFSSVRQVSLIWAHVYEITLTNGTVLWVPQDPLNSDYVRIQAWVAAGGVVS